MASETILSQLEVGGPDKVAALASTDPALFSELMDGLWSEDSLVRMRAADAVEKATRHNRDLLEPFRTALLRLLAETMDPACAGI